MGRKWYKPVQEPPSICLMISVNPGGRCPYGGLGSGRRRSSKALTTDYLSWDIRTLHRGGWLRPGGTVVSRWLRCGVELSSITAWPESDQIVVSYRHQYDGKPWESLKYPIFLDWTPCHYGGLAPGFCALDRAAKRG
jgi:hypothetical protein